jgi:hypothetical protein
LNAFVRAARSSGDVGVGRAVDPGDGVDAVDAGLEGVEFGGRDEVGLVEDDAVELVLALYETAEDADQSETKGCCRSR